MVQSRNRKVPENWDNSWGHVDSGPCIINVPVQCQVQIIQSNSVNTDTKGTIESVLINGVSVSSGLDLERI